MKRHGQEEFYMSNHRIAAKESPECSHTIIFDKKSGEWSKKYAKNT